MPDDFGQTTGGFSVNLDNLAGTLTDDPLPVLASGPRGAASKAEHSAGTYYQLQVGSTCNWTLKVAE